MPFPLGRPHSNKTPLPPLCLPMRPGHGTPVSPPLPRDPPLLLPIRETPQPTLGPHRIPGREPTGASTPPQVRSPNPYPALPPFTQDITLQAHSDVEPEHPENVYPEPAQVPGGHYFYDGELRSICCSPAQQAQDELSSDFVDLLTTSLRADITRMDAKPHTAQAQPPATTLTSLYPQVYQEYHRIQDENRRNRPYIKRTPRWAPDHYTPMPFQDDTMLSGTSQALPQAFSHDVAPINAQDPGRRVNRPMPRGHRVPKPADMPTWNVFRCDKPRCIFRDPRCSSLTRHVVRRSDHNGVSVSWVGDLDAVLPTGFRSGEPVNVRQARIQAEKQARTDARIARHLSAQTSQ